MKEILIKAMNEKADAYKNRGYNSTDAALSTVAYTAELALEAGILSRDDYAEVMKEYAKLYAEALQEEKRKTKRNIKGGVKRRDTQRNGHRVHRCTAH